MILKRVKTILLIVMMVAFALSFSLLDITPANANTVSYGKLTTSVQADTTLQKIQGRATVGSTSFEVKTSGMPNENDGSSVSGGYAVYIHPFYAWTTNNAIVFDTPISAEEMLVSGGLTIRMYAKLSSGNTYLVKGMSTDFSYGIYFYGLGATGDFSDHPVWVPADITQNEYVDFKINAYDASLLADSTGYVKGLVLGSFINKNEFASATDKEFYTSNPDPYIYIKSISYNAPDSTPAVAGEIKTYTGMGGLTHVNGYINDGDPTAGYNKYWDGYSPVDIVPGPRSYEPITELPLDNGEIVEKAYRFTYHFSSIANVAKNSVLFEKPLSVADIEKSNGMTLRLFAHLTSDGSDYTRFNDTYGLFFYGYGKGITGESDDVGVVVPANVAKDEWTDLYIPAEVLKTMVGDNGVLYGLNYGARIDVCSEAMYKGNPATNPGYILLSKVTLEEKTYSVTFKNVEETVNSYSAVSGSEIVMATAPVVAGKVFVGWETDSKLYSNSSELTLNADVVFNAVYVSFNMGEGASIRLDEPTGIRFITYLNSADFDAVKALVGVDKVSLGVRVVRGDNKSLEIAANNTLVKGENIIFNGVIKNLTKDYYTVTYTGAGFMDITYSDNTTGRIYANANDNTRTIAQVAQAAIEDPEIDATDFYTEAQYNLLRSFYEQQEA